MADGSPIDLQVDEEGRRYKKNEMERGEERNRANRLRKEAKEMLKTIYRKICLQDIQMVQIPGGMTSVLQPFDTNISSVIKERVRRYRSEFH